MSRAFWDIFIPFTVCITDRARAFVADSDHPCHRQVEMKSKSHLYQFFLHAGSGRSPLANEHSRRAGMARRGQSPVGSPRLGYNLAASFLSTHDQARQGNRNEGGLMNILDSLASTFFQPFSPPQLTNPYLELPPKRAGKSRKDGNHPKEVAASISNVFSEEEGICCCRENTIMD